MASADWIVLALYLLGSLGIGLVARGVRSPDDFFMGGRRFGKTLTVLFGFGAGTHTDQARLERLYRALQTPVTADEGAPSEPFAVPEGAPREPGPKVFDHPDWEIRWPDRTGWRGFAILWGLVVLLVGGVYAGFAG